MKFRFPKLTALIGSGANCGVVCPCKWFVLLLLCTVFCFGTRGTGLSAHTAAASAHDAATAHFAIADFDGDNRPDLATVETGLMGASRARYWIGFQMSAGAPQMIGVNGPVGGLEIVSRDVNGDNVVDLVVSAAWLKAPVAVLVNDGHGNFTICDPAAFSEALTNPSRTLDSPNQRSPDASIAISARDSNDFIASQRSATIAVNSEKLCTRNSLRNFFSLVVRSSGRAPPPSVHHV